MGADAWHRAAPFRKKLVRLNSGLCPDDAALAAWEAGYFPELTERPDVQDLLDAIARELSGDPVLTQEDRDEIFNAEQAAREREQTEAAIFEAASVPGRVIPQGSEALPGADGAVVYLYEAAWPNRKGQEARRYLAEAFRPGERKHAWHHVFPSQEARMERVAAFLTGGFAS